MISPELWAEVRRLFYAEHWKTGTIAQEMGLHRDTVLRAIEAERFLSGSSNRPSNLDPYMDFIRETLDKYPKLRSTRLHQMLTSRGYIGSVVQLRRLVRKLRPAAATEAYLKLKVVPGQQAQADWGHFGTLNGRRLSCFVMVLSWSRAIDALFTLDQTMESFLRGHVQAFHHFGGVARTVLYDNLKSAVLSRHRQAIQYNTRLLELAGHYHFHPQPVNVARGNEKGRVERQIRFLRDSFFAARSFRDVDDVNQQFLHWRQEIAYKRLQPAQRERTVAQALDHEKTFLLPLPQNDFDAQLVKPVRSGKTPYIRVDCNLYSIPHTFVRKPLTLITSHDLVRILNGQEEIARHKRSWEKDQTIENPDHIKTLLKVKANMRQHKGKDRLNTATPEIDVLFDTLAQRGKNLGLATIRLLKLLDDYGPEEFRIAIKQAIQRQAFNPGSVAHILELRRRAQGLKPPSRVVLPNDPRIRDLRVTNHNLEDYDELSKI